MIDGSPDGRAVRQVTAFDNEGASVLTHCLVVCLQLSLLVLLYGQTHTFGYVYFDDGQYVPKNPHVMAGMTIDSMHWAFTSFYMSNWHPLTWLSHMLDVSLFGPDPGWAHLHNVVLHGVNSLLVYALLLKLSQSWLKALLLSLIFLAHPLHVESVAWIAERKDLLSAMYFLLGLLLYDSYRAQPHVLRYFGVLACFCLALLAKPMAVTFPVVLLIFDFFVYRSCFQTGDDVTPDGKFFYRAIVEKLPFLALSVASSVVTILAQQSGNSVAALEAHSIMGRCVVAAIAYVTYLKQWLAPVNLIVFYPINLSVSLKDGLIPMGILLTLMAFTAYFARRLPLLAVGLCWFLVTLLPVIGLLQVGSQSHADRYMYLPSVGLLIACIYLLPSRHKKYFQLTHVLTLLFIVYLGALCFWQVSFWSSRHVLFSRVLTIAGPNYLANFHLAQDYEERGMHTQARKHAQAAQAQRPDAPDAYQALGNIALAEKNFVTAEKHYREALSKGPPTETILVNIGIAIAEQGDLPKGIRALEKALVLNPTSELVKVNLQHYRDKLHRVSAP